MPISSSIRNIQTHDQAKDISLEIKIVALEMMHTTREAMDIVMSTSEYREGLTIRSVCQRQPHIDGNTNGMFLRSSLTPYLPLLCRGFPVANVSRGLLRRP